jgi:hypothetical protein
MIYFPCDAIPNRDSDENISESDQLLELELWEAHILHRGNIAKVLATHSWDMGPVDNHNRVFGRICYRYTKEAWSGEIKKLLLEHRIPVTTRVIDSYMVRRGYSYTFDAKST